MSSAVASTETALSTESSQTLGERLLDSPTMAAQRAEAAVIASRVGWPDSRLDRPWKYLDLSGFDLSPYVPAMDAVHRDAKVALRTYPIVGERAALLVQENSETVFTEVRAEGLTLAAFEANPGGAIQAIIDQRLGSAVGANRNRFTALHYAFQRGGVLVHVAPNVEAKLPVRILRALVSGGQLAMPHTLIVTGANSRVTVIEEYRSSDDDIVAIPAVEILPGPGAEVRYVALHRWGAATRVFSEQRAVTERDSAVVGLSLATGGRVVKGHIESSLVGRGSSSELLGLIVGDEGQHIDFFTLQDHIGPDTRSDLLFKAALDDQARAVYYGLTRVGTEARNADANQVNRNLLLSMTAKADSDPVLEILTNDVIRVSHGATAGPVDDEQVYYLQTRGLTREAAEALLVRGFLAQVVDRVPDETLRAELTAAVERKLGRWL